MCTVPHAEPSQPSGLRRRTILELPLALAGALGLARLAQATPAEDDADAAFERLTERWLQRHAALDAAVNEHPHAEETYLRELALDMTGVPIERYPERQSIVYSAEGVRTGPAWVGGSIFIVEVTLEAGFFLAPHNHPGSCVLTLGVAGSCEVRHYEPEGPAPRAVAESPAFQVRERQRKWITPTRWSDLTRRRDNIHSFRAGPDGATLLDFTTMLGDTSVGFEAFSALAIDERPIAPATNVFEARWLGDPYR